MAISALTKLLSSGLEEGVKKGAAKALKKTTKETIENAVEKSATKAISKSARNAITDEVTDAAIKAMPKSLTGAGTSTLAKNAGSTLDGILGKSSGITLKNAKKPVVKNLADEFSDTALAKTAKQEISEIAGRNNKIIKDLADDADNMWLTDIELRGSKVKDMYPKRTKLPSYQNPDAFVPAEYPEVARMIDEGKLTTRKDLEDEFGEITKNYELTGKELSYKDKQNLLEFMKDQMPDEGVGITLEREDLINPDQLRLIDQTVSPRERKIAIDQISGGKKNIDVNRAATMEADALEPVAEEVGNPALGEEIASLREKIGANRPADAGMGGTIGTAPTEVAGSEGFNIKLKDGTPTNVTVGQGAVGSSKQQRAARKLDDMTAKNMNATAKQYRNLVGKSGSIDGHYKTVAERMRKEAIDQANVSQKAQSALALREDIKQQGLQYAERNGVTIDLSGIDNTVGLSAAQKRKLSELGLSLDDMLGGSNVVTPTQAEDIYKQLRDYAYKWEDSNDALTTMAGKAMKEEADAVRKAIDDAMDNINVDYKSSLIEMAAENGEDPAYLRKIAAKPDFKFSDLRKDQSDWIAINDLSGNKIKEAPTINVLGVDTGINNPFTAGADKIKEKIYERQAGGAAGAGAGAGFAGGVGGGNGVPTGAEGPINFQTAGAAKPGILGRAKDAGLVGAGVLGGLLLGGNGGGNRQGSGSTLGDVLAANQAQQAQEQMGTGIGTSSDPYYGYTVGGYTYDELAEGYARALQAGDASAAQSIASLMEIIENKASQTMTQQKYADSKKSSTSNNSASAVNVLSNLYDLYNSIQGGTGPIAGNVTNFMNTITGGGYNTEANTYWQVSRGALGKLIKGMGDTGALSEGDQKRALQMIPNITDTREAAEQKFMALYNILSSAAQM